jgi:predicted nucleotidyltransferase
VLVLGLDVEVKRHGVNGMQRDRWRRLETARRRNRLVMRAALREHLVPRRQGVAKPLALWQSGVDQILSAQYLNHVIHLHSYITSFICSA